jgi:Ca2+-binding EF-hand superfamily protein
MCNYIRSLDADKDDVLSRDEFISHYHLKDKNAEVFAELDKDNDGRLTFAELAPSPRFAFDAISEFCRFDTDLNGRVVKEELLAGASGGEKGMAQRLLPGSAVGGRVLSGEVSLAFRTLEGVLPAV